MAKLSAYGQVELGRWTKTYGDRNGTVTIGKYGPLESRTTFVWCLRGSGPILLKKKDTWWANSSLFREPYYYHAGTYVVVGRPDETLEAFAARAEARGFKRVK